MTDGTKKANDPGAPLLPTPLALPAGGVPPELDAQDTLHLEEILAQCYRLARERARKAREASANPQ